MGGWKTWLSVIGLAALGIVDIYSGNTESGMAKLAAALGALGIGHKIEKANK